MSHLAHYPVASPSNKQGTEGQGAGPVVTVGRKSNSETWSRSSPCPRTKAKTEQVGELRFRVKVGEASTRHACMEDGDSLSVRPSFKSWFCVRGQPHILNDWLSV